MSNENKTLNKIAPGGLHLINAPAEFEENLPKRVDEFIHNEQVFAQLDDFLRTPPQNPKILVLTNPLLEQRKSGLGKKTFVSEMCHMIKSKIRINIRWFDAQSVEIFHYHIDEFVKQIKADRYKKNDDSSHSSQLEALFAKIEAEFKWRTLFVIKNLQNWETIKDFVSEMIKSNKCKAILISRSNLKRSHNQMIRFVEFTFRPSIDDCYRYLGSHLKSKISSQQLNQIIEYQSKKFQQIINPVVLEKLAFYINYNYLYTIEGLIKQLYKIDGFQIIYVINFVSIVDSQSFLILFYAKYLYSDLIPIDLVKRLLSKKRLEIQNSVKLLLDLNLAELVDLNTIRISRLILDEVTESSEQRAKLELKLAETLSTQFKLSEPKMKGIYYPSVLSFLSMWKKFSVKPDDQEFNKHFAQLCFDIGDYNFKQKRLEIAMKYTEMGLKRESDQSEKFNYLLGECYFGLENFQKALEHFNSNSNSDESTKPYFMIGKCYYKCKNFLNAVTSLRKAYERNQKHIECVYLLARSYEMLEAYDISVKYNLEVLNLLKSSPPGTPNVVDQFSIYTSLGETMSKLKNYKMSLEYFEKAFDIVAKRSDKVGIAWLLIRMGENNLRLENYDQALNDFMTAYDIRLGDGLLFTLLELAEPLNLVGVVQRRKGNSAIALGYFDRAFRLRFKHHHSTANLDLVNSYINLGLANRDLSQFSKAENFFETAYEMKKQMDNLNEDDAYKLKVVEDWKRNQLRREMNRLKSGSMKKILMNKEKASLLNGKSLARVYLFCKDDASLFRELIDDEGLTEEDCAEFIKWFDNITLVRNA